MSATYGNMHLLLSSRGGSSTRSALGGRVSRILSNSYTSLLETTTHGKEERGASFPFLMTETTQSNLTTFFSPTRYLFGRDAAMTTATANCGCQTAGPTKAATAVMTA